MIRRAPVLSSAVVGRRSGSKLQDMSQLQASSKSQLVVSLPVTASSPRGLMPAGAISPTQAAAVMRADPHNLEGEPYAESRQDAGWPGSVGVGALTAGVLTDDGQLAPEYVLTFFWLESDSCKASCCDAHHDKVSSNWASSGWPCQQHLYTRV